MKCLICQGYAQICHDMRPSVRPHSPDKQYCVELLMVQYLGNYLEVGTTLWMRNLLAQPVIEPFQEPCVINKNHLWGRCSYTYSPTAFKAQP